MSKQIKDVAGKIVQIAQVTSKDFTAQKGPNKGKNFTIFSLGLKLDNGEWYNIKANSESKISDMMNCQKLNRLFKVGDEIKMYLESEDMEGKYWKITSIKMDTMEVEEEYIEDETPAKPVTQKLAPAVPAKTPEEIAKDKEDRQVAVDKFKSADADKYELGMAKNNAAVIFAAMVPTDEGRDYAKWFKENFEMYDKITESLFSRGKALRSKHLGY